MKEIRMGIVGLGVQGSLYVNILAGIPTPGFPEPKKPQGCVLSAVSTRSTEVLERMSGIPDIQCFTDWKEMIDSDACDAVIITVPHLLHHEIAIYALQKGKHVLCEKPADIRASDVQKMLEEHERHPELAFGLIYNQRVNPLFRKIKELIAFGELGEIRRSNWMINSWWRPDSYYESNVWRGTWKGEGGGLLVNQASHQLDLWLWFCGSPCRVFAKCMDGAHRNITVENDVTIVTEYENGATGTFISCTHDPLGTNRLEIDLSKGKIVMENNKSATVYRFRKEEEEWNQSMTTREMETLRRTDESQLYDKEDILGGLPFGGEYFYLFENFVSHINEGTPLIATGQDGLQAVRLANAARLSGWLGEEIAFPCDSEAFDCILQEHMDIEIQG